LRVIDAFDSVLETFVVLILFNFEKLRQSNEVRVILRFYLGMLKFLFNVTVELLFESLMLLSLLLLFLLLLSA